MTYANKMSNKLKKKSNQKPFEKNQTFSCIYAKKTVLLQSYLN